MSNKTTAGAAADPLETLLYQIFVAGGWVVAELYCLLWLVGSGRGLLWRMTCVAGAVWVVIVTT